MTTTIDKAGRVVIPAPIRSRAGFRPGTELDVEVDDFGVHLVRKAPGATLVRVGGRWVARPGPGAAAQTPVDFVALVEEERNRWP